MGAGEPWDLYVNPKKKNQAEPNPKPRASVDGTEELPGSPRPKTPGRTSEDPAGGRMASAKPTEGDAEFRRQAPRGAEEDAEVWDSRKGWTTPSGRKEGLAPGADGKVDTVPGAPVASEVELGLQGHREEDEDTEVTVAPKRAAPADSRPRNATSIATAKVGREGQDFQEYQRPATPQPTMVGGIAPQHQGGPGGSLGDLVARSGAPPTAPPASPAPPPPGAGTAPPRLYGQSAVPSPTPGAVPARPSGKTEIHDLSRPAGAGKGPEPGKGLEQVAMAAAGQVHAKPFPPNAVRNVLLIGSGAREHAMALALRRSNRCHLHVVMKHRNPGLAKSASGFKILDDRDAAAILAWARSQKVDLAVVGPESPLEAGVSDALRAAGIAVASPSRAAARIETSKTFMRELMERHRIPGRLAFHPFSDVQSALAFLDASGPEWAIKPVGLTGGKGVQVFGDHFADVEGAQAYVRSVFAGKPADGAPKLQFEEVARGEEFTLMAFTDGTTVLPMPAVQDHKRLREGDEGPNTGGMGSYSQADGLLPFLDAQDRDEAVRMVQALVDALRAEGTPYVGTIYGQFMLTPAGPKVIEVNARFGDPEAINALHLLESDYLGLLEAMATGTLAGMQARFRPAATVVKYVVPRGYGDGTPEAGRPIQVDEFNIRRSKGAVFFGALEQQMSGPLVTLASRTLAVLGEGATIEEANAVCEASLRHVHGEGMHVRHDIGTPELIQRRVDHMQALREGALAKPPKALGIRKAA